MSDRPHSIRMTSVFWWFVISSSYGFSNICRIVCTFYIVIDLGHRSPSSDRSCVQILLCFHIIIRSYIGMIQTRWIMTIQMVRWGTPISFYQRRVSNNIVDNISPLGFPWRNFDFDGKPFSLSSITSRARVCVCDSPLVFEKTTPYYGIHVKNWFSHYKVH